MSAPDLVQLLDRRVAQLNRSRPHLAEVFEVESRLIRASLSVPRPPLTPSFPLPREQVIERVRHGVPLLHEQPAQIDIHFAADLFSRLVDVLQQREDLELRPRLNALVDAATRGHIDPERLFAEAFVHHLDHLAELARQAGIDADLLTTVALHAVAPLLRGYASHLLPLVERVDTGTADGASWERGYCPVCGNWPMLGELRGVELAQWSRCAACGSGWRTPRLACPYCGNDDYRGLGYLSVDGEQRFRISVCQRCKGYLKVGNAFDPPPAELLVLDDVVSMHLDVAAIERGYHRPVGSGFTIELDVPDQEWIEELA